MSLDEIYKKFKHGDSLKGITGNDIYRSLYSKGLQVVRVWDKNYEVLVYNFIPETKKFELVK